MKKKLITLAALSFAGSTLFHSCFGGFGGLGNANQILQFLGDLAGDQIWLRGID